jgi:predicted permease
MSRREDREHDLDDEIRHHLRMAAEDRGAAAARREFGNITLIKEVTREMWGGATFEKLAQDLRYAVRTLSHAPALAIVAILSLALGIGANTAIFSLIDAVLLKSLPVVHPEQLFQVTLGDRQQALTNPLWEAVRDRQDVFSGILASGNTQFDLASGGEEQHIDGAYVSGDYFSALGVSPALGHVFAQGDDRRGCPGAAVLSYDFWLRRYGASPDVLNRTISLDSHSFPIAGVAAPGFYGIDVGQKKDVFLPICAEKIVRGEYSALDQRSWWWLTLIARAKPGVTVGQAAARLKTLTPGILADTVPGNFGDKARGFYLGRSISLVPAATGLSTLRAEYRSALYTLMAVVAVVLLIACANVANLLLARATVRQKEIAVRLALGAGRARLIRQLLTESLLLSLVGAVLGAIFARWGAALIVRLISSDRTRVFLDLTPDPRVLAFTIAATVLTGLLFGLAPAWRGTRVSPQFAMKENSRAATQSRSAFGLSNALVIIQVALSLILVACAGLLVGTFRKLETLDPGFDRNHVLLMTVDVRNAKYPKERRAAIYRDMIDRLRAAPGIRSASTSSIFPLSGGAWRNEIHIDGYTPANSRDMEIYFNQVSAGYFETTGTPMLTGRVFNDRDTPASPRVAVVNQSFAAKFFGSSNAVGKTCRQLDGASKLGPPIEIVGVVADSKYRDLREATGPVLYYAVSQDHGLWDNTNFELRAVGAATDIIPAVKSVIAEFNPNIVVSFKTLTARIDESLVRERLLATLSGFFGALALLLSAIGLYGVMSYRVARRRNEIGIRMALGAEQRRILAMVLRDVAVLLLFGLAAGIGAALFATRLVANFLYGVTARDPAILTIASVVLAMVAAAAGYLPARRAARLDPMTALREE